MNLAALDACVAQELQRAAVAFRLDEALGTHHGISWSDFLLLYCLDGPSAAVPDQDLARRLGLLRSHLLMRIRPLEKLGLVLRPLHAGQPHAVLLSPAGRSLLREARQTAAAACEGAGANGCSRS